MSSQVKAYGECNLNHAVLLRLLRQDIRLPGKVLVKHCNGLTNCLSNAKTILDRRVSENLGEDIVIILLIDLEERDKHARKSVESLLQRGFKRVCEGCRGLECYVYTSSKLKMSVCLFDGGPENVLERHVPDVARALRGVRDGFRRLKRNRLSDKVVSSCSDSDLDCRAIIGLSDLVRGCMGCALRELGLA